MLCTYRDISERKYQPNLTSDKTFWMNSTLGYVSWSTEEKNVAILLDMPYTVLIF